MNAYDLVLRSPAGLHRTQQVAAPDAAQAREQGARDGWQVIACEPRRTSVMWLRRRTRPLDVTALAHELSSLLSAGLSVPQSLQTLASAAATNELRRELDAVARSISEGLPLSAALERQGSSFPPLLVATMRASEQTGNLSDALHRYAEHQQRLRGLRDQVMGAAIYPMLLLALGTIVVLFLLGVVVPKFATLIEATRQELPWTSRLLMSWGRLVAAHPGIATALASAVLGSIAGAGRQIFVTGGRARWIDSLPVVGTIVREFRHAQLYRTTGMLVRGGIALPRALALGRSLLGTADAQRLDAVVALLHQGRALSDALQACELSDPVSAGMISVAERTGALAEILDRIAQFKESRLQRSIDFASRLIEPALMIFIGLVIGAIVVLMYLPIFDLASSLQ